METTLFDYHLPKELIAQHPLRTRDKARLLVFDRVSGRVEHKRFYQIPGYFTAGDVLILNDTRVIPARLIGQRPTGGWVELLLVNEINKTDWEVLVNTRGKLQAQEMISFDKGSLKGRLLKREQDRPACAGGTADRWRIRFNQANIHGIIQRIGKAPLPPYIKRDRMTDRFRKRDLVRYQTVYARPVRGLRMDRGKPSSESEIPKEGASNGARQDGAIAAPTAGLHFTRRIIKQLERKGVKSEYLTLHIGLGTFKPLTAPRVEEHQMGKEYFEVKPKTVDALIQARLKGRKIIGVGTSVCRVLETIAPRLLSKSSCEVGAGGWTDLFVYPPYQFKVVDAMITNFHLPQGTPLLMVSAFAGREKIMRVYQEAIKKKYRFYSYGDAMLIL